MPILFQYRNIRHLLGMYITKQAEQEIYLIAQKSYAGAPPKTNTHSTSQAVGAIDMVPFPISVA